MALALSRSQARQNEREALAMLQAAAASARTLLGPYTARKCTQAHGDNAMVPATLLPCHVEELTEVLAVTQHHPVVNLLHQLAAQQVESAGSGGTWAVVLSGLWAGLAARLLSEGVPRAAILHGLERAAEVMRQTVAQSAVSLDEVALFADAPHVSNFLGRARAWSRLEPMPVSVLHAGGPASCAAPETPTRPSTSVTSSPPSASITTAFTHHHHHHHHLHSCRDSSPASDDDEFDWFFDGAIDSQPPPKPLPTSLEPRPIPPSPPTAMSSSTYTPVAPAVRADLDVGHTERLLALLGSGLAHGEVMEMEMAVAAAMLQARAAAVVSANSGLGRLASSPPLQLEPDRIHVHPVVGLARDASIVMPGVCIMMDDNVADAALVQELLHRYPQRDTCAAASAGASTSAKGGAFWAECGPLGGSVGPVGQDAGSGGGWRTVVVEGDVCMDEDSTSTRVLGSAADLMGHSAWCEAAPSEFCTQVVETLRQNAVSMLVVSGDTEKGLGSACGEAGILLVANIGWQVAADVALLTGARLAANVLAMGPRHVGLGRVNVSLLVGGQSESVMMMAPSKRASQPLHQGQFVLCIQAHDNPNPPPDSLAASPPDKQVFSSMQEAVGEAVRVHGLVGAAHLNGCEGLCKRIDPATGRMVVLVRADTSTSKFVKIKLENLAPRARKATAKGGDQGPGGPLRYKIVSVLACSPVDVLAEELEMGVLRSVHRMHNALESGHVLHGGGALEVKLIIALQDRAATLGSVDDSADENDIYLGTVLKGVAETLCSLLSIVLQNCGMSYANALEKIDHAVKAKRKQPAHMRNVHTPALSVVCLVGDHRLGGELDGEVQGELCACANTFEDARARTLGIQSVAQLLRLVLNADSVITNQVGYTRPK